MADKKDGKSKKKIGPIKHGTFHEWLGKSKDSPITEKDIEKGLKSDDPHVRHMAQFAKNAKGWKHPKKDEKKKKETKVSTESLLQSPPPGWASWAKPR